MKISIGSSGEQVLELQRFLNSLAKGQQQLAADGRFGPKTRARVQGFQRSRNLVPDGVAGPLTMDAIMEALRQLGLIPTPTPPASKSIVRCINQQVLGMAGTNNLIQQIFPPIGIVASPTFRAGDQTNRPRFLTAAGTVGRLGIFAAQNGGVERAVILVLPPTGVPDRANICITQGFAQAWETLNPLNWHDPLSVPFLEYVLLKHVIARWGAQTLASKKQMAFVYIVRAKGKNELGPFAQDGAFMRRVLTDLVAITNCAFSFEHVEAFSFSSGITEFNIFLRSMVGHLNVETVYNIDPNPAISAAAPAGAVRKQFLSGQTFRGVVPPGFEYMPESRWANEAYFAGRKTFKPPWAFSYLHNHCMPYYALHLGIQLS